MGGGGVLEMGGNLGLPGGVEFLREAGSGWRAREASLGGSLRVSLYHKLCFLAAAEGSPHLPCTGS